MTFSQCRTLSLAFVLTGSIAVADDRYEPSDPIAAVDGDPIYVGELNLVLAERLGSDKVGQVGIEVQKATALLLVRRHLAMKSLSASGGEALQSMIGDRLAELKVELRRRGSSLSKHAKTRLADEKSLVADLSWKQAWGQYIKSKLNEENLRIYFDRHRDQYGGTFDELADQGKLRRDATSAMFEALVRKQKDAKIQWFIVALHPPEGVSIVPKLVDSPQ